MSETSIYLRTVLRQDVYKRLEAYAQRLQTGMDKWDFGVAIERLLDMAELSERIKMLEDKVEILEQELFCKEEELKQDKNKVKVEKITLLGGHTEEKN